MREVEEVLRALQRSDFRRRQKLGSMERDYLKTKGIEVVTEHARDFITKRLAPAHPVNDGKQTPWRGHPVFVAQHATATCCRGCLAKWHQIPKGRPLSADEVDRVVTVIRTWLDRH